MSRLITVPELRLQDFGPFAGYHAVPLPRSGLTLLSGRVAETGDGSGAGKSYLVNALAWVLGYCQFPATEMQSWYSDKAPMAALVIDGPDGLFYEAKRQKGLTFRQLPSGEVFKGKAAEAAMDRFFGMDAAMRAAVTYRAQDQQDNFLALDDTAKKEFLTKLLGLDVYERVAAEAAVQAKLLRESLESAQITLASSVGRLHEAERLLREVPAPDGTDWVSLAEVCEAAAADQRRLAAVCRRDADSAAASAREAGDRAAAGFDAETEVAEATPEPAELGALRQKLQTVFERQERVRTHDVSARVQHEQRRGGIRTTLVGERAAQRELVRLEGVLSDLRAQEAKLEAHECPTCGQDWLDNRAELERVKAEVDQAALDLFAKPGVDSKVAALEAELAGFPDWQPHPAGAELSKRRSELESQIGHMEADHDQAVSYALQAIAAKALAAREAVESKWVELARCRRAEAEASEKAAAANDGQARGYRDTAAQQAVRETLREERNRVAVAARERVAADKLILADTETRVNLELDMHALIGQRGFLGLIFQEVLNEIAAAANDILGRVANVRHVTVEFDPDKESKEGRLTRSITPWVNLRGERRSFESPALSGGMRASVRLAVDLGVGEVVAKRRGAYPGWLVLDESFNGLGPVSKESCMETLAGYAGDRLVLVVDHDDRFQGLFDQRITVEQVDGKSRVV